MADAEMRTMSGDAQQMLAAGGGTTFSEETGGERLSSRFLPALG